jgi:DNA-binding transcriptional ArsR family regulator
MLPNAALTPTDLDRKPAVDGCSIRVIDADRVEATRAKVLARPDVEPAAELFRLLGDPGRLQMLCALLEAGELCVCDLAAVVAMTESSVSHSLRLLRTAGIVRQRRSGRQVFYSLDDAHVRLLLDVSIEHVGHGGRS